MTRITESIRYAHCVKFTPGQLDREPWSQYEERTADIEVECIPPCSAYPEEEWAVYHNANAIAVEPTLKDALDGARYALMAESRERANQAAEIAQLTKDTTE